MASRCAPLAYLRQCAREREWEGVPSVTQLLNGTRFSWFKIKKDYAIEPDDRAFMIIGSAGHAVLESAGEEEARIITEKEIALDGVKGTLDMIEIDSKSGKKFARLVSYKIVGSYKAALVMGIYTEKVPVVLANGDPLIVRGRQKFDTVVKCDPERADLEEYALQDNFYRLAWDAANKIKVKEMKLFLIVRDGKTRLSVDRGIPRNTYYTDMPFLKDIEVLTYFASKKSSLLQHLEADTVPPLCNDRETWHGRRCAEYCEVRDHCLAVGDNPHLQEVNNAEAAETNP